MLPDAKTRVGTSGLIEEGVCRIKPKLFFLEACGGKWTIYLGASLKAFCLRSLSEKGMGGSVSSLRERCSVTSC